MLRPNRISQPSWMLTLASIAVVVAALYLAKGVLVPLTLAVLLSFLLSHGEDVLMKLRVTLRCSLRPFLTGELKC